MQAEKAPAEFSTVVEDTTPSVIGVPHTIGTSGGIHFIMTDELAEEQVEAEAEPQAEAEAPVDTGDWVNVEGAVEAEPAAHVEITETVIETDVDGRAVVEESVTVTTTTEVSLLPLPLYHRSRSCRSRLPVSSTGLTRTMVISHHSRTCRLTTVLRLKVLRLLNLRHLLRRHQVPPSSMVNAALSTRKASPSKEVAVVVADFEEVSGVGTVVASVVNTKVIVVVSGASTKVVVVVSVAISKVVAVVAVAVADSGAATVAVRNTPIL